MSLLAKILSLSYGSAETTKTSALKTYYRSVRFIKDAGTVNPGSVSYLSNVLLNGKCIDQETRCLYVFYVDTYYNSAWIIEINLDSRVQTVVYYDKTNAIEFDPLYKIHNAKVVYGRLVWTDNNKPIYQMDIERAKKSFYYKIGYGQYPNTAEWKSLIPYDINQIASNGNYFYKSNITGNTGVEPRTSDGVLWTKLCLIEEAYYSMNVENFYFEPVPPKLPPVVEYRSDDTRRVNSLRQILFQFAYRYVYMDYRKSTFSPASTTPVPQAEEETITGLANEQQSLNNSLDITINTGGEEVRSIEIVGRSSNDPSKWYLIETINKFDEEERAGEVSVLKDVANAIIVISIKLPVITNSGFSHGYYASLGLIVNTPLVVNKFVNVSENYLSWLYDESFADDGIVIAKPVVVTVLPGDATLFSFPAWMGVADVFGTPIPVGDVIHTGDTIKLYPLVNNDTYNPLTGDVVFTGIGGSTFTLEVSQDAHPAAPAVPVNADVFCVMPDANGLTIGFLTKSANAYVGIFNVNIVFTPNYPGKISGDSYTIYWEALINGVYKGSKGSITNVIEDQSNSKTVILTIAPLPSDVSVMIYLSSEPF